MHTSSKAFCSTCFPSRGGSRARIDPYTLRKRALCSSGATCSDAFVIFVSFSSGICPIPFPQPRLDRVLDQIEGFDIVNIERLENEIRHPGVDDLLVIADGALRPLYPG